MIIIKQGMADCPNCISQKTSSVWLCDLCQFIYCQDCAGRSEGDLRHQIRLHCPNCNGSSGENFMLDRFINENCTKCKGKSGDKSCVVCDGKGVVNKWASQLERKTRL